MTEANLPSNPTIAVIRQTSAKKISERATGHITYHIGVDAVGEIYFAIIHNAGGYFSREWVPLSNIQEALTVYLHSKQSFPTRVLRHVYTKRSNNNGGFLAAMLRHEGLLQVGDPPTLHRCTDRWTTWSDIQRHQYRSQQQTLAESTATTETHDNETTDQDPVSDPIEDTDQDPVSDPIEESDPASTVKPESATSTDSPPADPPILTPIQPPLKSARSRKR